MRYIAGLAALVLLLAFQQKVPLTDDEIIARGIEIKVEEFRIRQIRICREKVLKVAVAHSDSLIRVVAREQAVEPVVKPPKPQRPEKPAMKILPDSLDHDTLRRRQ